MASAQDYDEFYVSCNPPLLPHAVDQVVKATMEAHTQNEVIELLYEPEVPWFKVITRCMHRPQVTAFLQKQLLSIVEQDTRLLSPASHSQCAGGSASSVDVDVRIVGETPRVLPWILYEQEREVPYDRFDAHRFPATMAHLRHRAVWRGLEDGAGWVFPALLAALEAQWKAAGAPTSIAELEALVNCSISHNMAGTMVYIGTNAGPDVVEKAVESLDNLLHLAIEGSRPKGHLFITQGDGPFRFVFKWLSHIGQDRTTYVLARRSQLAAEYDRLQVSVRVRAERLRGQVWIPETKALSALAAGQETEAGKVFGPFERYTYPNKTPTAVGHLFDKIRESPKSLIHASQGVVDCRGMGRTQDASSQQYSPKLAVESWRAEVGRNIQEYVEEPWQEPDLAHGKLISLAAPTDMSAGSTSAGDLLSGGGTENAQDALEQVDILTRFSESEDLICLDAGQGPGASVQPALDQDEETDLLAFDECRQSSAGHAFTTDLLSAEIVNLLDEDPPNLGLPRPMESTKAGGHGNGRNRAPGPRGQADSSSGGHGKEGGGGWEQGPATGSSSPAKKAAAKGKMVELAESRVRELADVLRYTPGHVSLDLRFGRFYLKDLSHSRVDVGSGPSFWAGDLADALEDVEAPRLQVSTILSTLGSDMDALARIRPAGGQAWRLLGTRVQYEFPCTDEEGDEFVVEVDAGSFEGRCRGAREEVGSVVLHCVDRAWDMEVCATRASCLDDSPKHAAIAEAVAASLCTKSVRGEIAVEVTADERLGATMHDVRIRHVATYGQGEEAEGGGGGGGGSVLAITMLKRLTPQQRWEKRMTWALDASEGQANPGVVYEARIGSQRVEEALGANRGLRIGERAAWTCEWLEAAGGFEDICRPALGMIGSMDGIGALNNNGRRMTAHNSFNDTMAESRQRRGKTVFW